MAKRPANADNLYSRGLDEASIHLSAARAAEREGNEAKLRVELDAAVTRASALLKLLDMKALSTRKGN